MTDLVRGLTATVRDAAVADIAFDGQPVLDLIYIAVRDHRWRAAPGRIECSEQVSSGPDRRTFRLTVRHVADGIDFRWRGQFEIGPGEVSAAFEGEALSDLDANRIGFCLLHPQSLRGTEVNVEGPRGVRHGTFGPLISPYQLFRDLNVMRHRVQGAQIELSMSGDLFETEDHRNWSDPGWKTYCTPLSQPAPRHFRAGDTVAQQVRVRATGVAHDMRMRVRSTTPEWTLSPTSGRFRFPALGTTVSGEPVTRAGAPAVPFAHLQAELDADGPWSTMLQRAIEESAGRPMDLALVVSDAQVEAFAAEVRRVVSAPVARWAVFDPITHCTGTGTVSALRRAVSGRDGEPVVGGGSRAHLAELNRGRFDLIEWDFVTYGLTPQVHHTDDKSILGTVVAIGDGVEQARYLAGDLPVVVGPVTLRPRFNATTGTPEPAPDPADTDAPDLDPRQHEDLAGLYLAGALAELGRADAVTAYRPVGLRGMLDSSGAVSPAGRVFETFAALNGRPMLRLRTSTPGVIAVGAQTTDTESCVIAINLTDRDEPLRLGGWDGEPRTVIGRVARNGRALGPRSVQVLTVSGDLT